MKFKINYQGFYRKSIFSTFIISFVWAGLSTYIILTKSQLGEIYIPIFESILFITGLVTSRYLTFNKVRYNLICALDVIIEISFLILLFLITLFNGISVESAISFYIFIIVSNGIISLIHTESKRDIEDATLKTSTAKHFLKIVRGKHRDMNLIGLTCGSSISLILLTYLQIELKIYALILIAMNILGGFYFGYLVKKYLFIKLTYLEIRNI